MAAFGIERNASAPTATHSGFVAMLGAADFPTAAIDGGSESIDNGGGKLRVYKDSTKAVQYPIEVIRFVTGGTPDILVWVYLPTWQSGDTLYIERDEVATTQPAVGAAGGRNATWQEYYAALHLDDGSWVDVTGNGHDGTATGTIDLVSGNPLGGNWAEFDSGVAEYITIDNSDDFTDSQSSVTVQAIAKANSDTTGGIISNRLESEATNWFQINKRNGADEWQLIVEDGSGEISVKPTADIADPHWLALGLDSGSVDYTIDGTTSASGTAGGDGTMESSNNVTIGSYYVLSNGGFSFYGEIAEARLSQRYLTDDFRADEYTNQSDGFFGLTGGTWEEQGGGGSANNPWYYNLQQTV